MGAVANGRERGAMRRWRTAMALIAAALVAGPAAAALGGTRPTVDADRAHLAATMASVPAATHMVHILTLANGGTVREFVNGAGMVFAVAWASPGRPDLRQLLGPAFTAFQTDAAAPRPGRSRRPLMVRRDDLVVHSGGRPGAFHGFAYLPRDVPPGFAADALE